MKKHLESTGYTETSRRGRAQPARSFDALAVGLTLVLSLVAGGAAYASFTAGGSGSGAASSGTMLPVTISAFTGGDAPATTLVPGGVADVIVRVSNPNPVQVRVHSVVGNGPVVADSLHGSCSDTGVTFTSPASPLSPAVDVPALSSLLFHLPGAAAMDFSSDAACQGATFEIPVTLTARQ